MPIADSEIASALAGYLDRYPDEKALLAEPIQLLTLGKDFASRRTFTTAAGDVGCVQESEVTSAAWYPLDVAERLVGRRVARVSSAPVRTG